MSMHSISMGVENNFQKLVLACQQMGLRGHQELGHQNTRQYEKPFLKNTYK